jgi:hypothetical protein
MDCIYVEEPKFEVLPQKMACLALLLKFQWVGKLTSLPISYINTLANE